MAYDVGRKGGAYPVVFNAANEIAVQLFLDHSISFLEIVSFVENAILNMPTEKVDTISEILELDVMIREKLLFDYA